MTEIHKDDNAEDLANDLVECGFICEVSLLQFKATLKFCVLGRLDKNL